MGPRLFRRGNEEINDRIEIHHPGFNGATSFQTWKLSRALSIWITGGMLQWGHVFSDVEMSAVLVTESPKRLASMGPRLFRRGNTKASSSPRKTWMASMGPRLFRRGNPTDPNLCSEDEGLQWGHVFSDVEIRTSSRQR